MYRRARTLRSLKQFRLLLLVFLVSVLRILNVLDCPLVLHNYIVDPVPHLLKLIEYVLAERLIQRLR